MISAALAVLGSEAERNELSHIYEQNIRLFYAVAFSKLHNQHDAEDAIQEAFLSVANNPSLLFRVPAEKRVAYINIIVRNKAYTIWNKKHKTEENHTELYDTVFDEDISTEEKVISDFSCRQILKFIDTLSEANRSALYLKIHFGFGNDEIADALGISEEAAKKRISRAASRIRQYMEELKDE
ncbi:MAG: RNA polymerase sigma factor [Ruminiclostridium sp.]|nr:RNA polymerase sigma factor [Ruminiclostridium sp.]